MEKSFEYRIYPNRQQVQLLARTFGCVRLVYNHFLEEKIKVYKETSQSLKYGDCCRMLTQLKRLEDTAWLSEVEAAALQQSLRDLDRAFKNFFTQKWVGFPKFKKKMARKIYRTTYGKIIDESHVWIPKVGRVKARISRPVEGRIVSATIKQVPSGKYFIVFTCVDIPEPSKSNAGKVVGIDLGIASLVTTSDGEKIEGVADTRKLEKKLVKEQRKLSRKKKGSNNRAKQKIKVARVHEKIANKRKDHLHKVTAKLISENQVVCAETLNVEGMMKNHHLAKSIAMQSFATLLGFLEYKARERGKIFVQVDRWFASSKTCHSCGVKADAMPLNIRSWQCKSCGTRHDRDINAAQNILAEGIRVLEGTEGHSGTTAKSFAVTLVE
ncbi:MAG: RNA-guided endonuclease TnpB family protein [Varibaculum cambriense]|uniref:RNA-guided endonuclease TnpB family protein n=1 Tax=Varibaculum cambriense TaxID=184870 RepID=UPI00290AC634|nr:RNA-guided endonuclease TnpB family protein [Varibaculum cambriense]MDU6681726.1 RNA-guided endonuclease TnpB family protein [Varibaculum cambriense]